jgi:hypothetical protein
MNFNGQKTKEMMLGRFLLNPAPQIVVNNGTVEQLNAFKLLSVTIANDLSWDEHITTVCSKANKRLRKIVEALIVHCQLTTYCIIIISHSIY